MAYLLILFGMIVFLFGVIGLIRVWLLPLSEDYQIVIKRKDDYVFYETKQGKALFYQHKRDLVTELWVCVLIGVVAMAAGMYLGCADAGARNKFLPYRLLFGNYIQEEVDDNLVKEGNNTKYVDSDGKEYSYYIYIIGDEVSVSGVEYESPEAAVNAIRLDNTAILIDNYAEATTRYTVEKLLMEKGINFETEEK